MNQGDDNNGILQVQGIQHMEVDEGYEEPSSSSDVVVRIPEIDMNCNEAIPRHSPSEAYPVRRPSVIMPPLNDPPDSTTFPHTLSDDIMEGRHRRALELYRMRTVVQYLSELLGPDDADVEEEHLIHLAARDGRTEVVEALVGLGVDPNKANEFGFTPLHEAASSGKAETIDFLLSRGAEIDRQTNTGRTPLHLAAKHGRHLAVWTLLEAGARADAATASGVTPRDYASRNGHHVIADLIGLFLQ